MSQRKIVFAVIGLTFFIILILLNKTQANEPQKMSIVDPSESYDYVIITDNTLKNSFESLSDWKTKKGIRTTIVTVESIYNDPDYNGKDTPEEIRNFIIDAYNNWGISYILLGGDTNIIPYRGVYGIVTGQDEDFDIPCDLYYAGLNGNWDNDNDGIYGEGNSVQGGSGTSGEEADLTAEVYIGRAPVDNITEADNFVNKIITYEKNPGNNYLNEGLFLASQIDITTYGADSSDIILNQKIQNKLNVTTLYERNSTASKITTINEINNGQHIVNHIGHGSFEYLGLKWMSDRFEISDANSLTNGDKYFLFYSVGCDSNSFDNEDSLSEHFINNIDNGAFAYIGNSRYGWYEHGEPGKGPSERLNHEFFDAVYQENIVNLGKAFQDSKEDMIGDVQAKEALRWCYFALNMLGDPETPIWTDIPRNLDVSFDSTIYNIEQEYKVYVTENDNPLEDATVCLWQDSNIYEIIKTDTNGIATFNIEPAIDIIDITVSKYKYQIYENTINVMDLNVPKIQVIEPIDEIYHCNLSIKWNATDNNTVDEIRIEYKYEDDNWILLKDGLSNFPSELDWNLLSPYMINGNYLIKIIAKDNEGNTAENYSLKFEIRNPTIKIKKPVLNEIIYGEYEIEWEAVDFYNDIEFFTISLSSNRGRTYETLTSNIDGDLTSWTWDTTTKEDSKDYIIKIIANIGVDKIESFSNIFEIDNPDPPIANITVNKINVDEDEIITFDASKSSDPDKNPKLEYSWDFDDGNIKFGEIIEYAYSSKGIYNVKLTVTDETSLSDNESIIIIVNNIPPIADAGDYQRANINEKITFDASQTTDTISDIHDLIYSWNYGDGTEIDSGTNYIHPNHKYENAGRYNVTLTVKDNDEVMDVSRIIVDINNISITAKIKKIDGKEIAIGNQYQEMIFDATESTKPDDAQINYFWEFDDGYKGYGKIVRYKFQKGTNTNPIVVTLRIEDNDTADENDQDYENFINVWINWAPVPRIKSIKNNYTVNENVSFDATISIDFNEYGELGNIVEYYWDFGDGNFSRNASFTHRYKKPGNYTVTLIVTDDKGVENSTTKYVKIIEEVEEQEKDEESSETFFEEYWYLWVLIVILGFVFVGLIGYYYQKKKNVKFERV